MTKKRSDSQIDGRKEMVDSLNAANQQLLASGQQLRAANQQLLASDQQLRASNDSLTQQRNLAHTYLSLAGVIMVAIGDDEKISLINRKGCEILGVSEHETLGKNWFDLFVPERMRDMVRDVFHKLMIGAMENVEFYENPVITAQGDERIIAWHNTLIHDSTGKITGTLSSGEDITERKIVEESLRESEQRFRVISEILSDYAFMASVDSGGNLHMDWVTDNFTAITGWTIEDIRDATQWIKAFHPDDMILVRSAVKDLLTKKEPLVLDARTVIRKGISRWVHITAKPVIDEKGGAVTAIFGAVADITARRQAEILNERFRDLGLALSSVSDLKSGLSLCLDTAIAVSGMDGGGVYLVDENTNALDLVVSKGFSDDFVKVVSHYDADSKSARMIASGKAIYTSYSEHNFDMDDSRLHEGLKGIAVVPILNQSRVIGVFNVASHTTDDISSAARIALETVASHIASSVTRLRMQETLRREHDLGVGIMEASPMGILVVESGGRISFANSTAERILGLERSEIAQRTYNDSLWRITSLDGSAFPEENLPFNRILRTKKPAIDVRYAIEWPDGKRIPLSINAAPLFEADGSIKKMVAMIEDISVQLKTDDELRNQQRLESLGVLAGGIAHDFNNLLGGLFGYVDMVRHFCVIDETAHEYLDRAMDAFKRAKDLTQQLLTFSKGGAPQKKVTSIGHLLKDAAGLAVSGSNARCNFCFAEDLPAVEVDEGQISQVISNIVINARQAMAGGGTITISADNREKGNTIEGSAATSRMVEIAIADQGIGIPPDHLPKIFDPFFTTKQMGSGLGLAISYSIIRKHNGYITVESVVGKGTTFHVFLPAVCGHAPEIMDTQSATTHHNGGRILVMDDEDLVLDMACDMLRLSGYSVVACHAGEETVAAYQCALDSGKKFDAVLLDLTIPGSIGGAEVMNRILAIDQTACGIVSSGYADDPILAEFENYGFKGVAVKPYRLKDLSGVLRKVLSKG